MHIFFQQLIYHFLHILALISTFDEKFPLKTVINYNFSFIIAKYFKILFTNDPNIEPPIHELKRLSVTVGGADILVL